MLGLSAVLKFSQDREERFKTDKEADSLVDLPVLQNTLTHTSKYTCHLVWRVLILKRRVGKSVLQPTSAVSYIIYIKFAEGVLLVSLILISLMLIF